MTHIREALGATLLLAHRFRLMPTKAQHRRLRSALEHSRQLYNAALEERIGAYRRAGKTLRYMDQARSLTELRQGDPEKWATFSIGLQRFPLQMVDRAYKAFFERGGYPRFRGYDWFKTIGWSDSDGWRIRDGRFLTKGIGAIRIHLHSPFPDKACAARIKREGQHWYLIVSAERGCSPANDNPAVGIDMGINQLAALSNGTMISNERFGRRAHAEIRRAQRALARAKRGSRNRRQARERLSAERARERRQRDTYLHQISAKLARTYGVIAIEKLMVKNMVRDGGATKTGLNRAIHDASWGRLKVLLRYKCALNGGKLIEVDPKGTSQLCSGCGVFVPKQLSQRWHDCPECGLSIDRDHNAALNVLHRAVHGPDGHNVAGYGERAHGKAAA